jgi:hypothetical protein
MMIYDTIKQGAPLTKVARFIFFLGFSEDVKVTTNKQGDLTSRANCKQFTEKSAFMFLLSSPIYIDKNSK